MLNESISKNLTLIIPTHERHRYLKRVLEYYEECDLKIIVIDSSKNHYSDIISNTNVEYIHCPSMDWIDKALIAAHKVESEYLVMCADDDFLAKTSFEVCLNFLNLNPEYEQVQGFLLGFNHLNETTKFNLIYPHSFNYQLDSDSPIDRLESYYKNFIQLFYVVRRTAGFRDALIEIKDNGLEHKTIDQAICSFSVINGKTKVLPIFFGAREYIPTSNSHSLTSVESLLISNEYIKLMDSFFKAVSLKLSSETDLQYYEAQLAIRKIYSNWIQKRLYLKLIHQNNRITDRIKKRLSNIIKTIQLQYIYRIYGIRIDSQNNELFLLNVIENKELQHMKELITKHRIVSLHNS